MNIEEIKKLIRDLSMDRDFLAATKARLKSIEDGNCKIVISLDDSFNIMFQVDPKLKAFEVKNRITDATIETLKTEIEHLESKCLSIESKIKELAK